MEKDKTRKKVGRLSEKHSMRYFYPEDLFHFQTELGFEQLCSEEWLTKKHLSSEAWGVCHVFKN